jgi:hypothetical protein
LFVIDDETLDFLSEILAVREVMYGLVDLLQTVLLLRIVVLATEAMLFLVVFGLKLLILMTEVGQEGLQAGDLLMKKLNFSVPRFRRIFFFVFSVYFLSCLFKNQNFLLGHSKVTLEFDDLVL